jgi:hypothetical protein
VGRYEKSGNEDQTSEGAGGVGGVAVQRLSFWRSTDQRCPESHADVITSSRQANMKELRAQSKGGGAAFACVVRLRSAAHCFCF